MAPVLYSRKMETRDAGPYILPWTRKTIEDAMAMAGTTIDDLDVIETHDCFTSSEYVAISCFGIEEPGFEYRAIEDGRVFSGGRIPVNPSGGLIGCGHPVGASGVRMLLDLHKQVSGRAGAYQVQGARTGAMLNIGGSATSNFSFVVGRDS